MKPLLIAISPFFAVFLFGLVFHIGSCDRKPVELHFSQTEIVADTNPIFYSVMFREGFVAKQYNCPAGVRTQGFGVTTNLNKNKTLEEAQKDLLDSMLMYYKYIEQTYTHLKPKQIWAVVSIGMNCRWESVFGKNSSFHKALVQQQVPPFEKFCYYKNVRGRWCKAYNLEQSRLYEKALFEGKDTLVWCNPYRDYCNESTTVKDVQQFYYTHWKDRIQ